MKYLPGFFAGFFFKSLAATAQVSFEGYEHLFTKPLQYKIYRTSDVMKMDGSLLEPAWKAAEWSTDFIDIEGDKKPQPTYKTRFKMLWDDSNFYIAAELEEPHIWSYLSKHDTIVFYDNDFEVFIDPDGDTHNYFEIEVNALKNVFDLFLSKPYRNGGDPLVSWDAKDVKTGVKIEGTLNNPADKDKKWVLEMSVPFRAVSLGNTVQIPSDSTIWRLNFSRVEWDTEVVNKEYKKKIDSTTGRRLPEKNWVWSPQGVINMHLPERWGYVQFSTRKAGEYVTPIQLPSSEELKKYLWLIYYKQHSFYRSEKKFAGSLSNLNFPDSVIANSENSYLIKLDATANLFETIIKDIATGETWRINQSGEIRQVSALRRRE